eukprot:CAMPEP_0171747220 /NCGR_PEP_ID=MMETSP0991-20121206/39310_1 /TAXON_ID=483369 /ORGANISM="non described non described, Strain CCMP2098" /LENGTH=168 /DNA_ID=CAMNT_0012347209 /DNA_START=157 /DNA_END=661 /DNA_ORIENTATION=-
MCCVRVLYLLACACLGDGALNTILNHAKDLVAPPVAVLVLVEQRHERSAELGVEGVHFVRARGVRERRQQRRQQRRRPAAAGVATGAAADVGGGPRRVAGGQEPLVDDFATPTALAADCAQQVGGEGFADGVEQRHLERDGEAPAAPEEHQARAEEEAEALQPMRELN